MSRDRPVEKPVNRTRQVQLIDLEYHMSQPDGSLTRNKKKIDRGEQCYFASPYEMPAYVRFTRTVDSEKQGTNTTVHHLSTTGEFDLYTAGVKVYVKWDVAKHQYVLLVQEGTEKARVVERFPAK